MSKHPGLNAVAVILAALGVSVVLSLAVSHTELSGHPAGTCGQDLTIINATHAPTDGGVRALIKIHSGGLNYPGWYSLGTYPNKTAAEDAITAEKERIAEHNSRPCPNAPVYVTGGDSSE